MDLNAFYRVYDVFTPTSPARLNFVTRSSLESRLTECLVTPGKQIVLYGETGSGKSSLLNKTLPGLYDNSIVVTRCTNSSTFDSMILDAFDQLDTWFHDGLSTEIPSGRKVKIEANLGVLRGSVEGKTFGSTKNSKRLVPPQITVQRLGETMGELESCWVIEDFHKVEAENKLHLAQALKVFSDLSAEYPRLKIIAVGATDTARQVVKYDREMKNRIAEVHVPLMDTTELHSILGQGADLLNISFAVVAPDIVRFSSGLPSICHNFALNTCLARGIDVTQRGMVYLEDSDCGKAVNRYIEESSDTLKATFEKALLRHRTRSYDNCRLILTALAELAADSASHAEILGQIRRVDSRYPASNLTRYLTELCTDIRGCIIQRGGDGRYRFSEPLYRSYAQAALAPKGSPTSGLLSFSISFRSTLTQSLSKIVSESFDPNPPTRINNSLNRAQST